MKTAGACGLVGKNFKNSKELDRKQRKKRRKRGGGEEKDPGIALLQEGLVVEQVPNTEPSGWVGHGNGGQLIDRYMLNSPSQKT